MSRNIIRYYDSNTPRFLRFGQGAGSAAIHRAVWAEGVGDRRQAMEYVNTLVEEAIRETDGRLVLDIGCGIGGSLAFLAGRTQARFLGLTISAVQGEIGRRYLRDRGCGDRCSIIVGDFTEDAWLRQLEAEEGEGFRVGRGPEGCEGFRSCEGGRGY
ncbi:MAG: SAM-dependent methyltransferase, partial [Sediminispirochaetaceae bacterium]